MAYKRHDQIEGAIEGVKGRHGWGESSGTTTDDAAMGLEKTGSGGEEGESGRISKETEEVMRATQKMDAAAGGKNAEGKGENTEVERIRQAEGVQAMRKGERPEAVRKGKEVNKGERPLQVAKEGVEKGEPGPKIGDRGLSEGSLEGVRNSTLGVSFQWLFFVPFGGGKEGKV